MPAAAESFRSAVPIQVNSSDAFGTVLDVVCKEFAPGIAPLTTEQLRAAALLADEAWRQYCEAEGDASATVRWVREQLKSEQSNHARRPPMDARTAVSAFQALFDLHSVELPKL